MSRLLFIFLIWFLHLPSQAAGTSSFVVERAFYRDTQEAISLTTLPSVKFESYTGDLRLGYQPGATWLRLTVKPDDLQKRAGDQPLIVRVGPLFLDQIEVYEWVGGQWLNQAAGDQLPPKSGACTYDGHCFVLRNSEKTPQTIYLRVKNVGLMFVRAEVLTSEALTDSMVQRAGQRSISLTLAGGLLLLGLIYWGIERSKLLLTYCGFQAATILSILASLGMIGSLLWPLSTEPLDLVNHLVSVLRVGMTILLCRMVLASYNPSPAYKRVMLLLMALSVANAVLIGTGYIRLALQLNFAIFFLNPVVQVYELATNHTMPNTRRRILLGCYVFNVLIISFGALNAFGGMARPQHTDWFQHFGDWRLNGVAIGVAFFWIVMSEQASRNKARSQELEALRLEAAQARATHDKLSERRALIDMLTHELKTPLGTIKFALATLKRKVSNDPDALRRAHHIDSSVKRMDDMIEHVARSDKIELLTLREQVDPIAAGELVHELIGDFEVPDRFIVQVQPGTVFRTERQMLLVILENLLGNALKYALAGSQIQVAVTRMPAGGTCFEIRNQVEADALPDESRLFERYYRHPSAQSQPGMGIGLSLVHSAARKIGASVAYQHGAGWVTFTVSIPE